ncbi:MAG: M81 family metallopeptidase [Pseudomonadota bacterium]
MAKRVAIAGFQHETNTFAPFKAGLDAFQRADSWPGLLRGDEILSVTRGLNLPIAGFAEGASNLPDLSLIPLIWCAAEPSGPVTSNAFDRIAGEIIQGLREAGPLDGLYLDLHGAMVSETETDGEGALLSRIRAAIGNDLPIAISLDLHANISPLMVEMATVMAVFRTYPHLDMAETGARCLPLLCQALAGWRPAKAFRRAPFLIPLHAQYTGQDPARGLYARAAQCDGVRRSVELALGFTAADIPDTGPAVIAYADSQDMADRDAARLMEALQAVEAAFDAPLLSPEEAVRLAMSAASDRPVVLADVQDNPGAGASSDTTGLLRALIEAGARGALLGLLHDPEMAARAHRAGIGSVIEGALGGKSGQPGQRPYHGRFHVERLGDGICAYTGAMYGGGEAILGPTAVLRPVDPVAEVQIMVTSERSQCLDLALFTNLGLDPKAAQIVCVKSTVHYRADFEPIAGQVLSVAAPGGFSCRLEEIPYRRLRPGLRLPGGQTLS